MISRLIPLVFMILVAFPAASQKLKLVLPVGHDLVTQMKFTADDKYLLSMGDDDLNLWDVKTGRLLETIPKYGGVNGAIQLLDTLTLVVSKDDSTALFDLRKSTISHTFPGGFVAMNKNRIVTAVAGEGKETMYVWDSPSRKLLTRFEIPFGNQGRHGDHSMVDDFLLCSNGQLWNLATGSLLIDLKRRAVALKISADKKELYMTENDSSWSVSIKDRKITRAIQGRIIPTRQNTLLHFKSKTTNEIISALSGKVLYTSKASFFVEPWDEKSVAIHYPDSAVIIDQLSGKRIKSFLPDGTISEISYPYLIVSKEKKRTLQDFSGKPVMDVYYTWQPSSDGRLMATGSSEGLMIVDLKAGGHVTHLSSETSKVGWAGVSCDGSILATTRKNTLSLMDFSDGKIKASAPKSKSAPHTSVRDFIATPNQSDQLEVWPVAASMAAQFDIPAKLNNTVSLSGRYLVTVTEFGVFGQLSVFDTKAGKSVFTSPGGLPAFSKDESTMVYINKVGRSDSVRILRTKNFGTVKSFKAPWRVRKSLISDDGKYIVVAGGENVLIYDTTKDQVKSTEGTGAVAISPDSRFVAIRKDDYNTQILTLPELKPVVLLPGAAWLEDEHPSVFTKDSKLLYLNENNQVSVWEVESWKRVEVVSKDFYNERLDDINHQTGKLIFTCSGRVRIYDLNQKNSISLTYIDSVDWVVTHSSGLFDASQGAMSKLYFVQEMQTIELNQLKERYYEPGLWKKYAAGEKLRNVGSLNSIKLPPDILLGKVDDKGYLPIHLKNKKGGIGAVSVLINGSEMVADARPKGADIEAQTLTLKLFVGNNRSLVKGGENFITVKCWNSEHYVYNKSSILYHAKGEEEQHKPAIHILTSGVSDYTGTELDLKYAAKDAEDMSRAIEVGARALFGTEKSYVYQLTTSSEQNRYPTKAAIVQTFEKIASAAHPLDVVLVYLSGHGINYGGVEGDWYYLTQEAHTTSGAAYNDPGIRKQSTLASAELMELFNKIPALKKVLIIDACASGKVVENLMAKKDIESSTLRALDRMRDRTGIHIITGCTADAVSYEASKYGQGVLTYSLLEGIRGAALRDNQFVDVNQLFQYAQERVPALAEGIGGIQTPQVFSPQGAQSFDIGKLEEEAKKQIPIASIRPVYIRSTFLDEDELEDALQLGKKVDDALNEVAGKGTGASIIFVDVRDYPDGCKLSGRYKQENGSITMKLRKKCGGADQTIELKGATAEELLSKIMKVL